jgi:hypothetical protein
VSVAQTGVGEESSETGKVIARGGKLVGETFLPGASLIIDGEVTNGLVHTAAGFGARALLGTLAPFGVLFVMADSYSKSVTDKYLHEHIVGAAQTTRAKGSEVVSRTTGTQSPPVETEVAQSPPTAPVAG